MVVIEADKQRFDQALSYDDKWVTYRFVIQQATDDLRLETSVKMAAKNRGRDIKAAANFTLGQAMYVLSQIVRKPSPIALIVRER